MDDAKKPTIAVLGRRGLILEVVAQAVVGRGYTLATDTQLNERSGAIGVTILVDPKPEDWRTAGGLAASIIVMLDREVDDEVAVDALLAGADAVISASDDPATIERALDIVAAGEVMLPRAIAQVVLTRLRLANRAGPSIELTPRERDILGSIAEGDAIKQTARKLGITVKTVQNLQSRLFRKLDARNRAQAITRAHELGLLEVPYPY